MSEKRRDNRNRVLRDRESQMKDGRYCYTFYENGKQKRLYSWRLEKTDKLPIGKRECISLREQVKELNKKKEKGLPYKCNVTVYEIAEKHLSLKKDIKDFTKETYRITLNTIQKEDFANTKIDKVKKNDVKLWYIKLKEEDGYSYTFICNIKNIINPAFQEAVEDGLIEKNPFNFSVSDVIANDTINRKALTKKQEEKFLNYISNDNITKKYYDAVFLLFKTGLRISELCGLTLSDLNMKERYIDINHQLVYFGRTFRIETPKSNSGIRRIPMSNEVYECCKRIIENKKKNKIEAVVDGVSGFLFIKKNGKPSIGLNWAVYFKTMCKRYNLNNNESLKITPHICRHTYCSNMAKSGMNPKTLQYLMGHSNVATTLDWYTHIYFEDAQDEMKKMLM